MKYCCRKCGCETCYYYLTGCTYCISCTKMDKIVSKNDSNRETGQFILELIRGVVNRGNGK